MSPVLREPKKRKKQLKQGVPKLVRVDSSDTKASKKEEDTSPYDQRFSEISEEKSSHRTKME